VKHDENAIALFGGKFHDLKTPSLLFVGIVLILLYVLSFKREGKDTK